MFFKLSKVCEVFEDMVGQNRPKRYALGRFPPQSSFFTICSRRCKLQKTTLAMCGSLSDCTASCMLVVDMIDILWGRSLGALHGFCL